MIPIDSPYLKKTLYRFEPMEQERIKSIIENKLWLSMAKNFNDPFDSQALIAEPCYRPETFNRILKWQQSKQKSSIAWPLLKAPDNPCVDENGILMPSNWRKSIQENLRSVAMCCFSENWDNHQLWSYYAQSHKGFCLEYEFNLGIVLDSESKTILQPINYASHYPYIQLNDLLESKHPLDKIRSLLCTKNLNWQHEKEWRFILFNEQGGKAINMPEGVKLKGILAGCEMDATNYDDLKRICETSGLNCEQLTKDLLMSRLTKPSLRYETMSWNIEQY